MNHGSTRKRASEVACAEGKCTYRVCTDAKYMDCNHDTEIEVPDGCETNILESADHCGKCGNACSDGMKCEGGNCCYGAKDDIGIDRSLFQCCAGYSLYEYQPHFALPFCWDAARYACSDADLSASDGCWSAVK